MMEMVLNLMSISESSTDIPGGPTVEHVFVRNSKVPLQSPHHYNLAE